MVVALNSIFQMLACGVLGWFYVRVLPGWLHLPGTRLDVSGWDIARNVLIFLGIPLAAGYLTAPRGGLADPLRHPSVTRTAPPRAGIVA